MKFDRPIIEGVFLKRYKRFFADIKIGEKTVVAHVPNSGSMMGCKDPESPCLVSFNDDPKRKLQYTLEMIKTKSSWVGINTMIPNKIVKEALENKVLKEHAHFKHIFPEAKINEKSRLDFALTNDDVVEFKKIDLKKGKQKFHFIEVKNVSLAENTVAKFPDAVTERGQKHLLELMKLMDFGHTCEILFTIQRTDCKTFSPAQEIDSDYAKLLEKAHNYGVIISPFLCDLSPREIKLTTKKLPLEF